MEPAFNLNPESFFEATRLHRGRNYMLDMMRYTWRNPQMPLIVGHHTLALCNLIDEAKRRFLEGVSTHAIVVMPFRHGKTDGSSRYGPANFIGWNPDIEVMMAAYNSDLAHGFSQDIRGICDSPEYRKLYPEFQGWSPTQNRNDVRQVAGRQGRVYAFGMGSGATGKGAHVLVIDDAFKNREEAESETVRESRWNSFIDDFMSRLAPVHIVLIVQTRWHVDDLIGRILNRNNPDHEDHDPEFPEFELVHFRARGPENVKFTGSEYLFPQRFGIDWYETQFGTRSEYSAASLLQGEPFIRGGKMLKADQIQWLRPGEPFPEFLHYDSLPKVRFWDIAHSEKERAKDDPDYTAGGIASVIERKEGNILIIDDLQAFREEATERNRRMNETAGADGQNGVQQHIEANGAQKSAYTTARDILKGVAVVAPYYPQGDKVARAGYIEPICDAGNIYIRCSPGVKSLATEQISGFPTPGVHDDVVDVLSGGYECALKRNRETSGKAPAGKMHDAAVA